MTLNIVSRQNPDTMRERMEILYLCNTPKVIVKYLRSYGERIHEFTLEHDDGSPFLQSLEGLQEIQAMLDINEWDLRVY